MYINKEYSGQTMEIHYYFYDNDNDTCGLIRCILIYYVRPKMVGESSNNTHHPKGKQKGHSLPSNRVGGKTTSKQK